MTRFRLLSALTVFIASALVAGCGDTTPTPGNTAPSDKQIQKEAMKGGPGGGGPKSK